MCACVLMYIWTNTCIRWLYIFNVSFSYVPHTHTYILLYICIKLFIFQNTSHRWSYSELHNHPVQRLDDLPKFTLRKWKARASNEVSWFIAKSSFHYNSCHWLLRRSEEEADLASLKLGIIDSDWKISSAFIFQVNW